MIKIDENNNVTFESAADETNKCELCGVVADLRPYGPNHERICIKCGEKNPEMTERRMHEEFDRVLAARGLKDSDVTLIDPDPLVQVLDLLELMGGSTRH